MSMKDSNSVQEPTTAMSNEESRSSKFLRVACNGTMDEIIRKADILKMKTIYGELLKLNTAKYQKLFDKIAEIMKKEFKEELDFFLFENKFDEKFKELETLSEGRSDKKKTPAWRPTGLSVSQQLMAHEVSLKVTCKDELEKLVSEKEEKVHHLKEQIALLRSNFLTLENQASHLDSVYD